jgi:hypothetical protein
MKHFQSISQKDLGSSHDLFFIGDHVIGHRRQTCRTAEARKSLSHPSKYLDNERLPFWFPMAILSAPSTTPKPSTACPDRTNARARVPDPQYGSLGREMSSCQSYPCGGDPTTICHRSPPAPLSLLPSTITAFRDPLSAL